MPDFAHSVDEALEKFSLVTGRKAYNEAVRNAEQPS